MGKRGVADTAGAAFAGPEEREELDSHRRGADSSKCRSISDLSSRFSARCPAGHLGLVISSVAEELRGTKEMVVYGRLAHPKFVSWFSSRTPQSRCRILREVRGYVFRMVVVKVLQLNRSE